LFTGKGTSILISHVVETKKPRTFLFRASKIMVPRLGI
jgi:hypothetical protein